jgi:alpha-beta hydrolase superfamily lysophospholipase
MLEATPFSRASASTVGQNSMAPKTKRRIKTVFLLLGLALLVSCALVWHTSDQLVSPPRRSIKDYHIDWLSNSTSHGIGIRSEVCLGGDVPCLVVVPDARVGPSRRAAIIRCQLDEMDCSLNEFGRVSGTLVLLHGRKGRKEDLLPVAERFCAAGFRCILPDLPAHGESPLGNVSYGLHEREGALAAEVLGELSQMLGFDPRPAGIWGISMGGAFATRSVSASTEVWECAVIVSSFDKLSSVLNDQCSSKAWVFGPVLSGAVQYTVAQRHGLDCDQVHPAKWAKAVRLPVMVAHGTEDTAIAMERGRALFDAFRSREKRWVEVEGGTHGDVLITPMPLYATMASWFLEFMVPKT